MKAIVLLFLLPLFSFAQTSNRDSIKNKKIGIWNPIDYPHAGIHSIWIDCANPFLFVNDKIDFTQMEYIITGGTYEQGEKINQINLIPFEKEVSIQFIYKGVNVQIFTFKTLQLIKPDFVLIRQNGDTLTDQIPFLEINKVKVAISTDDRLSRDLIKQPFSTLQHVTYTLSREDTSKKNKRSLYIMAKNTYELKKLAKKNDKLVIEATVSTSRYSYSLNKQIKEEHKVIRSYHIK
ncbi:MAG: hypothetical protein H7282_02445 [Cytophagaceae bacterium]|nr:hypothetical protein [Cytophagaceae bacterium]